jgi:hypothetical protein
VTHEPAYRMCANAPLWEHVQGQGMIRQTAYSDAFSCDDFANGVATADNKNYWSAHPVAWAVQNDL